MTPSDIIGWRYQRDIDDKQLPYFEDLAENMGAALDVGEGPDYGKGPAWWRITLFFDGEASRQQLVATLSLAEKMAGLEPQPTILQPVHDEDWQAKSLASFPPVVEGPFFIYGFETEVPEGKIGLHIPAGMAFGSGEHATTALCLLAMTMLQEEGRVFKNILDMGAGSGILAISAAKTMETEALAVDVDKPSVVVCRENILNNDVEASVQAVAGNGFKAAGVAGRAPYDLIFANILMNPLLGMVGDIYSHLAQGGYAILSGFTHDQVDKVATAYISHGFEEISRTSRGDWCALVIRRP